MHNHEALRLLIQAGGDVHAGGMVKIFRSVFMTINLYIDIVDTRVDDLCIRLVLLMHVLVYLLWISVFVYV